MSDQFDLLDEISDKIKKISQEIDSHHKAMIDLAAKYQSLSKEKK